MENESVIRNCDVVEIEKRNINSVTKFFSSIPNTIVTMCCLCMCLCWADQLKEKNTGFYPNSPSLILENAS